MGIISKRHSHTLIGIIFMGLGIINKTYPYFFDSLIPEKFDQYRDIINWTISIITFLLGLGMLFKQTRRIAKWPLLTLLIVTLPSTISEFTHVDTDTVIKAFPPFFTKLKLPLQIVILFWVWWATRDTKKSSKKKS